MRDDYIYKHIHLNMSPIKDSSDVVEVEELSQTEFTNNGDQASIFPAVLFFLLVKERNKPVRFRPHPL